MGDRNYYQNQYDYGYSQQSRQSISNLFDMGPSQGGGFSVNTPMPSHDKGSHGSHYDRAYHPNTLQESGEILGYRRDPPPPSYEQFGNDRLVTAADRKKNYCSPAWNFVSNEGFVREEQQSKKRSFSNLFDVPDNRDHPEKSTKWSEDGHNFSQKSKSGMDPYDPFEQSHQNFSSRFEGQLQQSSYQPSGSNLRQDNYQSGFGWRNRRRSEDHRGGRGNFKRNEMKTKSSQKGDQSFSEDNLDRGEEGDGDNEEDHITYEKGSVFYPDSSLIEKYKYYPPTLEEMGEMFKDLVIFFFYKVKNVQERNPFVVICESFRRSYGYCSLDVDDGYDVGNKCRKFCTLRYQGMIMVRGVGDNNNLKEPRVQAGVELINQLAMSCYTLEAKSEYYSFKALERMLERKEVPGVYRVVPQEEVHDFETGCQFLQQTKDDSDSEFIFNLQNPHLTRLKGWARNKGYECRVIKQRYLGVCKNRSPQYWRDKILASGSLESERYTLKHPQGIGNLLIPDFKVTDYVIHLRNQQLASRSHQVKYGPKGVGPTISSALPPWSRRGGSRKMINNQNRLRKIVHAVEMGCPLEAVKEFKFLKSKKKIILKQELRKKGLIST